MPFGGKRTLFRCSTVEYMETTSVHPPFNVPTKVDVIEIALGKAVVN